MSSTPRRFSPHEIQKLIEALRAEGAHVERQDAAAALDQCLAALDAIADVAEGATRSCNSMIQHNKFMQIVDLAVLRAEPEGE